MHAWLNALCVLATVQAARNSWWMRADGAPATHNVTGPGVHMLVAEYSW